MHLPRPLRARPRLVAVHLQLLCRALRLPCLPFKRVLPPLLLFKRVYPLLLNSLAGILLSTALPQSLCPLYRPTPRPLHVYVTALFPYRLQLLTQYRLLRTAYRAGLVVPVHP